MGVKQSITHTYDKHYKKFMIFSFVLLALSGLILVNSYVQTGELFSKGVSLKGGITLTTPVSTAVNIDRLELALQAAHPNSDIAIRSIRERGVIKALIVEAADITEEQLIATLPANGIPLIDGEYSIEVMGSTLSSQFFKQTLKALIYAFIAMAIVVFIIFRSAIPSMFVILAAVSDIISTLAVLSLLQVRMSTAGLAALLMLIGYSVDTDILLTTKVLKRKNEGGKIFNRIMIAFRTGILITTAALAASIVGLIFSESETVKQIMLVITIGLIFDAIYTWCQNAGILRWYLERKTKKEAHNNNG